MWRKIFIVLLILHEMIQGLSCNEEHEDNLYYLGKGKAAVEYVNVYGVLTPVIAVLNIIEAKIKGEKFVSDAKDKADDAKDEVVDKAKDVQNVGKKLFGG